MKFKINLHSSWVLFMVDIRTDTITFGEQKDGSVSGVKRFLVAVQVFSEKDMGKRELGKKGSGKCPGKASGELGMEEVFRSCQGMHAVDKTHRRRPVLGAGMEDVSRASYDAQSIGSAI